MILCYYQILSNFLLNENGTGHFFNYYLSQRSPLKRNTNFIHKFHKIERDRLLKLVIFWNNQTFLQFCNFKNVWYHYSFFQFFLRNFYFAYIFGAALYRLSLEPNKVCCSIGKSHRHLSNIDCLKACTTCLVCFISTFNGHHKKKPWKTSASSGHITNCQQSILDFRYLWKKQVEVAKIKFQMFRKIWKFYLPLIL